MEEQKWVETAKINRAEFYYVPETFNTFAPTISTIPAFPIHVGIPNGGKKAWLSQTATSTTPELEHLDINIRKRGRPSGIELEQWKIGQANTSVVELMHRIQPASSQDPTVVDEQNIDMEGSPDAQLQESLN